MFESDEELLFELAGNDAVFSEICGDYLSLSSVKPADAALADLLADSLSSLEDEIRNYLSRIKSARNSKEQPPTEAQKGEDTK